MVDLVQVLNDMVGDIITAIPAILGAIIVIALGYIFGSLVGKAVNHLVERIGLEKSFDQSSVGRTFRSAGLDLSNVIGMFVKAFIIIISIIFAIEILNVGGTLGFYLQEIAAYLPRLLAGLLIIILGAVLVDFLASFIGKMIRPMFPPEKVEIADMLKNLLFIGLIAFILLLALDTMLLSGSTVYPLILGFVIIGAGISLTDVLIKSIIEDHSEFKAVAGYAKFILYSVFLIIGAGAIFATFPGVTSIVGNVSWAFAIALALMLVPVAYMLTKRMTKEMN
ncbi:MAG: hypothetical protein GXX95_10115 [Methanomassiliicoccus sp.]|jgi:hypothetical protein|nr:hypothetical protein [Methanomassiliicoccus sp.]